MEMFSQVLSGEIRGKLVQGDCLKIMPHIPDKRIDMILCDLPYGTTACKWDTIIPFKPLWEQYKRIIKDRGAIALTATQPFASFLVMSNVTWFKYEWIWDKVTARGHLVAKKRPMAQHENILVFYKKAPTYNPQMVDRPKDKVRIGRRTEYKRTSIMGGKANGPVNVIYDKWYPKTIITVSGANSSIKSMHPTQKPVKLFEYLIKTYTNENDLILDNCIGSGTTAVAAENLDRRWIGIELDPRYVKLASGRMLRNRMERASRLF